MKKIISLLLAAILVLFIGTASVFAVSAQRGKGSGGDSRACPTGGFVDADNDGTCDNAGSVCPRKDVECPAGRGNGFVDADRDGTCDNSGSVCPRKDVECPAGRGNGGCGNGRGCRSRG